MKGLGRSVISGAASLIPGAGIRRLMGLAASLSSSRHGRFLMDIMLEAGAEGRDGKHPFYELLGRFTSELNLRARRKIIGNLFLKLDDEGRGAPEVPPVFFISVTSRCNLRCKGCSAHKTESRDLPPELLDRIIGEATDGGAVLFALAGGEPFVRGDITELLRKHNDSYFIIFTNGTLMNNDTARALASAGNALVLISVEGGREATDSRRGEGTYERLDASMDFLHRHGVAMGASVLVTPENFDEVTSDDFVERLIVKGVFTIWYITYKPVGDSVTPSLLMPADMRQELYDRVVRIRNTHPVIAIDHETDMASVGGCLATTGLGVHINASGGIEPCGILHYHDTVIGGDEPVKAALNKSALLKEIKGLYHESPGCPLIERPAELAGTLRKAMPGTYSEFSDYTSLMEYACRCGGPSAPLVKPRRDIYGIIAGHVLSSAMGKVERTKK